MRYKILILIILVIGLFLVGIGIYGACHSKYSKRVFGETLTIQSEAISEIAMSDFSGHYRSTKDQETIDFILGYFEEVQYKRLINDQTAYMPSKARIVYLYSRSGGIDFIVPYGKEAMISYKVYQVKDGIIEEEVLFHIYQTMLE